MSERSDGDLNIVNEEKETGEGFPMEDGTVNGLGLEGTIQVDSGQKEDVKGTGQDDALNAEGRPEEESLLGAWTGVDEVDGAEKEKLTADRIFLLMKKEYRYICFTMASTYTSWLGLKYKVFVYIFRVF